ncbi:hypothetical protein NQZ68_007774 [Dissostichus eleginoides]|nr:hypothetical protein NQZ68_007774 [Dissostichus eleginoides]
MTTTHNIYIPEFMPILLDFLRLLSKSFIVTDGYFTQHWPPLISYGVISSQLSSVIRLGTITLPATTTKHARQVWLPPLPQIDIKLSHRASAIKHGSMVSAQTSVKGYRRPASFALSQSFHSGNLK